MENPPATRKAMPDKEVGLAGTLACTARGAGLLLLPEMANRTYSRMVPRTLLRAVIMN